MDKNSSREDHAMLRRRLLTLLLCGCLFNISAMTRAQNMSEQSRNQQHVREYFEKAEKAEASGNLQDAVRDYQSAADYGERFNCIAPASAQNLYLHATELCLKEGNRLMKANQNNTYYIEEWIGRARSALVRLCELDPNNPRWPYLIATQMALQEDRHGANQYYKMAIQRKGGDQRIVAAAQKDMAALDKSMQFIRTYNPNATPARNPQSDYMNSGARQIDIEIYNQTQRFYGHPENQYHGY